MSTGPFSPEERAGVYRAIAERRDIRNYRPDPIPEVVLWRILGAAHRAPSVGLMQPWDFILLSDPVRRRNIYEHFRSVNERAAAVYSGDRQRTYRALKLQGILDAPLNLVVTCDRRRGGPHVLGRFTMRHMDEYSTCLAVQNLWLAARAEGVGVGWMSVAEPSFIAHALGLPPEVIPVAYLTLGYPVEFPSEPLLETTGWERRHRLEEHVFGDQHGLPYSPLAVQGDADSAALLASAPAEAGSKQSASARARERQDALTKPAGSLGRLEELGLQLAALQRREYPSCEAPCLLLFAGDHGVAEEGVSAYLPGATAQMVYAYLAGGAAVNALCRQHQIELRVVDVGVDHDFGTASGLFQHKVRRGTRNFSREPAMTEEELERALAVGARLVYGAPRNEVLGLGEMGIANSTAAAAVLAALTGQSAEEVVGRGTGVSDATLARKRDVVQRGLDRHRPDDATSALRSLGGLEIAALVGAIEAAARAGKLVVLDGFITGVAALVAQSRDPRISGCLVAGHRSAERAHRGVLERLGLRPLLDLDLRLGEGSGAALALPIVQSAARLMREMRTFEEANLDRPLDPRDSSGPRSG
jgi:nicotinate-nucleotide--dimethylbenzimidazole phosphoribosyltransferase